MNNSNTLNTICKPLFLFLIFEAALITYYLTQSKMKLVGINVIMTLIGSVLIYLLCSGGFEIAAWLLLAIVPFFFVAFIAFLIVAQIAKSKVVIHNDSEDSEESLETCAE